MKKIFEIYNKLTDEEKNNLEDLYIIHELYKQIKDKKGLNLNELEQKILYENIKKCFEVSNISCKEIISRLVEMLNCVDITICDVNDLEIDELVELLSKERSDFKDMAHKKDILFAITTNKFYCLLLKYDSQYMLICEKDNGIQYQRKFRNLNELAFYLSRKFLQEQGELFV